MVVFAGIAVLYLGALVMRYLRNKKCNPQCPSEPGPETLKIIVSYCPRNTDASGTSISQISEKIINEMHRTFVDNASVQKWRVQLTVVDALFSSYLKQNSKEGPVCQNPSITVTFQTMSRGNCFPCDEIDTILTIISSQFTKDLCLKEQIDTYVVMEPVNKLPQSPWPWQPTKSVAD